MDNIYLYCSLDIFGNIYSNHDEYLKLSNNIKFLKMKNFIYTQIIRPDNLNARLKFWVVSEKQLNYIHNIKNVTKIINKKNEKQFKNIYDIFNFYGDIKKSVNYKKMKKFCDAIINVNRIYYKPDIDEPDRAEYSNSYHEGNESLSVKISCINNINFKIKKIFFCYFHNFR